MDVPFSQGASCPARGSSLVMSEPYLKGEQNVFFLLDQKSHSSVRRRPGQLPLAGLLAAALIASTGCSASVPYRIQPELPYKKSTLRTMGLLPPTIELQETLSGSAEIVRDDDWSREARENVFGAIISEMPVNKQPLVLITDDGSDLSDMADLFSAVDYTIRRHVELGRGPAEPLPGGTRPFAYSLGPAKQAMERHQVDAVWFVTGLTVLAPPGVQAGDAARAPMAPPSAGSGNPASALIPRRCELRAALVDMNGAVLFYGMVDDGNILLVERDDADRADAPKKDLETVRRQERGPDAGDLRDPDTARRYVRALFSEYRKAVAQ